MTVRMTAQQVKKKSGTHKITQQDAQELRGQILGWYDRYGRDLPWRYKGGAKPDPYRVWLSEIMLQQTTVPAVLPYYTKFLQKWPDLNALAAASQAEILQAWAGLGYYARARNLHACAQTLAAQGGQFPQTPQDLRKLPGIGEYTSAALTAILYNRPAVVLDGNIERIVARLFAIEPPMPAAKPEIKGSAAILFDDCHDRPGDLAQALMDLGAAVCTPRAPSCALCPMRNFCQAAAKGMAEELPRPRRRQEKPRKQGYVYWIENSRGEILLERRAQRGLFAGMLGLPTSEWQAPDKDLPAHPAGFKAKAVQQKYPLVLHSFTHFDLALTPIRASVGRKPAQCEWQKKAGLLDSGLPTLFKKAAKVFLSLEP